MKGRLYKTFNSYSKAGYVTAILAIVRTELHAQEASSFCDFEKNDLLQFHLFYSFLTHA